MCRSQRRLGKESDANIMNAELQKALEVYVKSEEVMEDSEDDESEESGSTDEESRIRRRAQKREERRRAKELAWMTRLKKEEEHRRLAFYHQSLPAALADEDMSMDVDVEVNHPARLADLDTPAGR